MSANKILSQSTTKSNSLMEALLGAVHTIANGARLEEKERAEIAIKLGCWDVLSTDEKVALRDRLAQRVAK